MNKSMKNARLQTFGANWWPHDADDDHGASSEKARLSHLRILQILSVIK